MNDKDLTYTEAVETAKPRLKRQESGKERG